MGKETLPKVAWLNPNPSKSHPGVALLLHQLRIIAFLLCFIAWTSDTFSTPSPRLAAAFPHLAAAAGTVEGQGRILQVLRRKSWRGEDEHIEKHEGFV